MTLPSRLRSWLRATLRRSRLESEMDAELRFDIEAFAKDLVRSGVCLRVSADLGSRTTECRIRGCWRLQASVGIARDHQCRQCAYRRIQELVLTGPCRVDS